MSTVPRFIRENPDDPKSRYWVETQVAALNMANIELVERIAQSNRMIEANKAEIVELMSYVDRGSKVGSNGR